MSKLGQVAWGLAQSKLGHLQGWSFQGLSGHCSVISPSHYKISPSAAQEAVCCPRLAITASHPFTGYLQEEADSMFSIITRQENEHCN